MMKIKESAGLKDNDKETNHLFTIGNDYSLANIT